MTNRVLIAGSGGQGIMLIGKILARAALDSRQYITFFPAYGAEVRGGTSNCQVVLSSEEISSPLAEEFDNVMIMNQPSLERFMPRFSKNCLGVVNSSLCHDCSCSGLKPVDATVIANKLGDKRAANFVMLGALLAEVALVPPGTVENEITRNFQSARPAIAELNILAFRRGLEN